MAREFNLSVVAPDRTVVEEKSSSVVVPAFDGYMGVMAGHVPSIVALKTGMLEFRDGTGTKKFVTVHGGFMEIDGDNVIILANAAEHADEIDVREAEETLEQARRALRGEPSELTSQQAAEEMERALNRIRAARVNGGR